MARAKTKAAPRPEPPKIPLRPGRLNGFDKYDIMDAKELDAARNEIEYVKTSIVLGRPFDLAAIIELAERSIKTAQRIDAEAKAINEERNENRDEIETLLEGIVKDLKSEHQARVAQAEGLATDNPVVKALAEKLAADAKWFSDKAASIENSTPETMVEWTKEYDAVRHEK